MPPPSKAAPEFQRQIELLRSILDTLSFAVIAGDREGNIFYANPAAEQIMGYPLMGTDPAERPTTLGLYLPDAATPCSREELPLYRAARGEAIDDAEIFVRNPRRPNGIWLNCDARPLRGPAGQILGAIVVWRDVSDRKRSEETLRESEEKYRQLFATATDAIVLFDGGTKRYLDANDAALAMYGYARDEFLQLTVYDTTAEIAKTRGAVENAIQQQTRSIALRWHKRKDGSVFPVEISASVFPHKGRPLGLGVIRNVEDRIKADQAVRESEARFRHLVRNSLLPVALLDIYGRVLDASDACLTLTGYDRRDVQEGRVCWSELAAPEHGERIQKALEEVLTVGKTTPWEMDILRKDGNRIPIYIGVGLLPGSKTDCVAFIVDLADLRRMEEKLHRQTRILRTLLDNMAEGVLVADEDGRILLHNRAAELLFGPELAEVPPREWASHFGIFREDATTPVPHEEISMARALRGEESRDVEVFVRNANVPRGVYLNFNARPLYDERNALRGGICVFRDVTARRREAEAEALRERDAMQREFLANVSHEFRTPVAAIKGFAETLVMGAIEDPKHRMKFAKTIERHADRLSRLVEDLLELSALESNRRPPRPEAVALAEFVAEGLSGIQLLAERNHIRIQIHIDPALSVWADKDHLARIFQHLLENAVKFNRREGSIDVEARVAGGAAEVRVRDTGCGIPPKDLPHVFERFHRSDKHRLRKLSGSGLGLSIVKQSVEANGGRIWVESADGKGSIFHFTLPPPPVTPYS